MCGRIRLFAQARICVFGFETPNFLKRGVHELVHSRINLVVLGEMSDPGSNLLVRMGRLI